MEQSVAQAETARETIRRGRGRPVSEEMDPRVIGVELKMELVSRDMSEFQSNDDTLSLIVGRNRALMQRVNAYRACGHLSRFRRLVIERDLDEIDANNVVIRSLVARNKLLVKRVHANRGIARAFDQGPCAA